MKNDRSAASLPEQVKDLLYQALETELGGVEIYRTAIQCAVTDELRAEWEKYLAQTEDHARRLRAVCEGLGLDPEVETPGRQVVRFLGKSLVQAMALARAADDPAATELVAAECVVLAETKDHLNWSLLGLVARHHAGLLDELARAHAEVEDQEDHHLYHTAGWARELWLQALGLEAMIPPPEEEQQVESAMDAARASQARAAEMDD